MSFTFTDIIYLGTATPGSGGGGSSLPDQTGHSGEFLTTDGSAASWSNKPLINDTNQTAAVAVGEQNYYRASAGYFGTAVGGNADAAGNYSIAYGYNARATAERSIQIGTGTNNDAGSLKVATMDSLNNMANYTLLDRDGAIPTDRFTTTPSADGTYVPTLTISSGTPTRSWAAPSGGLPSQTGQSGKFLTTDGTDASWATISALQNTATASSSLTISGTAATNINTINIGSNSNTNGKDNCVLIGYNTSASKTGTVAIGSYASATQDNCIALGTDAIAKGSAGIKIGAGTSTGSSAIAIGSYAQANGTSAIKLGGGTSTGELSIAIGSYALANATRAIQLGFGTNTTANTFSIGNVNGNYEMMSADGTIPTARLTKVNSTITLTAAGWSGGSQTVTVTGVTSTSVVLVAPDPSDTADYVSAGILCTSQTTDSLTFTATTTPTNDIDVNIVCL